jgi:hypothetical protein
VLIQDFFLFVKGTKHPQEYRYVSVLAEKDFGIAKLVGELLSQFFFREQRDKLIVFEAYVGIRTAALCTSYHFVPHHGSALAVSWAWAQVLFQETAAVPMDSFLRGGYDLFQRLKLN